MNILFICDEFPPGKTGGIGIATEVLAKALAQRGHNVIIAGIYPHGYGGADEERRADGITVYRLRYKTDFGLIGAGDSLKDRIIVRGLRATGLFAWDARRRFAELMHLVRRLISERRVDVIEMPDWNNFFFNIRVRDFVIPRLEVPLVVKMHGSYNYFGALADMPLNTHFLALENALYRRADSLCAVSAFTGGYCRKLYGLDKQPEVMYNGVMVGDFIPQEARSQNNTVVFSGSLLPKKGILSLAACWAMVVDKVPGAQLHVYGKGKQDEVRARVHQRAAQSVTFFGHVPHGEIMAALSSADLAVFPSYSETFGMAAAEAMGVGCPVVFTKYSSGPEIITDGKEGWLADPADVEQLAAIIVGALLNPDKRAQFARAGYEKAKSHFEISSVAQKHERYYAEVIASFKAAC